MLFSAALALAGANVALAASASRPAESTIEPAATAISAAAASSTPVVLTSDVKGKGFDRIVQIWLENTVRHVALFVTQQHPTDIPRTMLSLPMTQA